MANNWSIDNLKLTPTQKKAVNEFIYYLLPTNYPDQKFKYYAAKWFINHKFDKTQYTKFINEAFNDKIHNAYTEEIKKYIKKEDKDNNIKVTPPTPTVRSARRFISGNNKLDNDAANVTTANIGAKNDLNQLLKGNTFIDEDLPDELQFAKTNWWNVEIEFESDFDRACYITKNRIKRSTRDKEYTDWIKSVSGYGITKISKLHGKKVFQVVKLLILQKFGTLGNGPSGKITVPKISLDFTPKRSSGQTTGRTRTRTRTGKGAQVGARITATTTQASRRNIISGGSQSDCCAEQIDILEKILKTAKNITELLSSQQTLSYSNRNRTYISEEEKRRRQTEKDYEASTKQLKQSFTRMLSPVQGIMDNIIEFLITNILAKSFIDMIKWVADPKNKEMVSSLGRFFKDWWPALLGTFVLYCTSFGKFVRSSIGFVINLGKYIASNGFRALRALLASAGKKALYLGAAIGGTYLAANLVKNSQDNQNAGPKADFADVVPKRQSFANGGMVRPFRFMNKRRTNINDVSFDGGGPVDTSSGMPITGAGQDTQLVALSPGEYVMTRSAVNRYGAGYFESLNKSVGKLSRPGIANNIQLANQGGEVGIAMNGLMGDEKLSSLTRGVNDYISPGLKSAISNIPWSKIASNPKRKIYAYDGPEGNNPTIGWGATFYDSLRKGKKRVRSGDVITKAKADDILKFQVGDLSNYYSSNIPYWKYMTDKQKAGLMMFGFNAGVDSPLGGYRKLSAGIKAGNMRIVAKELQRNGPTKTRISMERSLVLSGPLNLKQLDEEENKRSRTRKGNGRVAFAPTSPNLSTPGPRPQTGGFDISTLPPIYANQPTKTTSPGETMVESFSAIAPKSVSTRTENAELLGIKV